MRMERSTRAATVGPILGGLAAALVLAGCSAGEPEGPGTGTAGNPGSDPSSPATTPLDWSPLPGSTRDTVTSNGEWTLTVAADNATATLEGPGGTTTTRAGDRERVGDAFLTEDRAVLVLQDRQETRPARAVVVELDGGEEWEVGPGSEVPTTTGGTWATDGSTLVHATVTDEGRYCLTTVDLEARSSELGWCAPERHGFNGARVTDAGTTLMTFDDSRPSCRTVVTVRGAEVEPFVGVEECKAWDSLLLGEGTEVWSVVPKENQVEAARLHARTDEGVVDLGPGTSGTLVGCGGAAWFVRDPQRDGDPARLMRWSPGAGLSVAYETTSSPAFLAPPRCGGDTLNLTALAEGGDEHVTASLG